MGSRQCLLLTGALTIGHHQGTDEQNGKQLHSLHDSDLHCKTHFQLCLPRCKAN